MPGRRDWCLCNRKNHLSARAFHGLGKISGINTGCREGNEAQRGDRIALIHPKYHEETSVPCPPDHLPICKCLGLGTRDQRQIRNQRNQRNQRAAPMELGEGPDPLTGCHHPGGSWSNPAGFHRGRSVLFSCR